MNRKGKLIGTVEVIVGVCFVLGAGDFVADSEAGAQPVYDIQSVIQEAYANIEGQKVPTTASAPLASERPAKVVSASGSTLGVLSTEANIPTTPEAAIVPEYVQIAGQIQVNDVSELNFNQCTIEDFAAFVDELLQFPNLQRVEMCNTNLSNEQMQTLRELFPDIKFVWVVHCAGFSVRTDAVAFSTMFTGYGWDPHTEADFEVLRYCTDLEALDLGHHSMVDVSFLSELKNLKILIIAINKIQDISPLAELTNLTYLELFLNQIVDLTPLENLVYLEHLNLCHNKTLGEIEPILHFPKLQRLWISYCNLTSEEIARIREAYPNAWLEFDVYESVQAGWRSTEVYPRMRNVFNNNQMDEMFLPKLE